MAQFKNGTPVINATHIKCKQDGIRHKKETMQLGHPQPSFLEGCSMGGGLSSWQVRVRDRDTRTTLGLGFGSGEGISGR